MVPRIGAADDRQGSQLEQRLIAVPAAERRREMEQIARCLADKVADLAEHDDPVVQLALRALSAAAFLDVDTYLVRLLEAAVLLAATIGRASDATRHFREAVDLERQIDALPYLAHSLVGLADTLAVRDDAGQVAEYRGRARGIAERLGMTVLLERLVLPADEWRLARDREDWVLEAGDECARLRNSRGLHYLRALLAVPRREIRALDLAAGGAGLAASGMGPALDAAARNAYRARLEAVAAQLDAADRTGDRAAAEEIDAERHAVLAELRRAVGLGGRSRMASPEAERARVNVTRTLRATIERIAPAAPRAAAHLRASIRTGAACRYDPAPGGPSRWHA
jgi:hypothetical protein